MTFPAAGGIADSLLSLFEMLGWAWAFFEKGRSNRGVAEL